MPCAAFEDRLLDYADLSAVEREAVSAHTAICTDCRDYLETLTNLDTQLTHLLSEAKPSLELAARTLARARTPKLTALPELLDFVGWSAVAGILSVLAWWLPDAIFRYAPYGAVAVAMVAVIWMGFRSWVELRE